MRIAPFCLALSLTLAACGTTRPVDRAALERQQQMSMWRARGKAARAWMKVKRGEA